MWSKGKKVSKPDPVEQSRESWFVRSTQYIRLLASPGASYKDYLLLTAALLASIAAGVPFPLLGILFGELIDEFNTANCDASSSNSSYTQLQDSVQQKVLSIIYVTIASFCFIYIHTTCWSMFGERLVRRLREKYLRSLLRQELAFYDQLPAGDVSSRLSNDLDEIQKGTSERVGIVISSISYFVASYIVAFIKEPILAATLVSLVPVYVLMAILGGHFTTKYTSRYSDEIAKAISLAEAGLGRLHIVTAFGAARRLEVVFADHLGAARVHGLRKAITAGVQLGLMFFVAYATNALAYWQGSRRIASNEGTVGAVYTVIFLLIDASFILSRMAPFLQIFGTAVGAAKKLNQAIARKPQIDGTDKTAGTMVKTVKHGFEFEDVEFFYPARPSVQILKKLTLSIPANKHTAIVGQSGSGKSTMAALMTRLYDPVAGSIKLDGVDLPELNTRSLRRCFGVVQQDPALLDRSILENIAHGLINADIPKAESDFILRGGLAKYAKHQRAESDAARPSTQHSRRSSWGGSRRRSSHGQDLSPELRNILLRVEQAIDIADARFVDKLPQGLSTSLRVAGKGLSGGQQQRIALARAMVRDPQILLLDEATSALDSASEKLIQRALDDASQGRTTISIAHRLSTIKNADKIIVMHNGEILEQGSHQELIDLDGSYAGMVKLQQVGSDTEVSNSSTDISETSISTAITDEPLKVDLMEDTEKKVEKSIKRLTKRERKKAESGRGLRSILLGIAKLARKHWVYLMVAFSSSIIVGGSYSGEAVIFGMTVSSFSTCNTPEAILSAGQFWGLLFFILAIVEFLANFFMSTAFGFVSEYVLEKVRILSFRTLFHQDLSWHESDGRDASTSLSYLTTDANSLAGLTGPVLGTLASVIVSTLAGIVLSLAIAWRIAIVLLACVPVLLGSGVMRLRCLAKFHEKHAAAFAKATGYATEAVNSIRIISTFSLEDEAVNTYHKALEKPYGETRSMLLWSNGWLSVAYSISNLVYALAYYVGAKFSIYYSQTQFFIVLTAMLFSAQTCGQLFALAPDFSKSKVSAARILDLLDAGKKKGTISDRTIRDFHKDTQDPELGGEKVPETPSSGEVIFTDVHFAYPSRPTPILRGLDLHVRPGQFVALVGPSGAGKSTVIAMIEHFYEATSGNIIAPSRDEIALVPQDGNAMFEGTVRFNISLGARPGHEATDEEIIEACKAAQIHDTIMNLPENYNTRCGPNGSGFSGGQKQRLAIARALLRQPKLLLLDESTSALDSESEQLVQQALSELTCTVIAIAHRLHTIQNADNIYVIEEGRCTGNGTHSELLLTSETYRLNAMQQTLDA